MKWVLISQIISTAVTSWRSSLCSHHFSVLTPQEAWPTAAGVSFLPPQERKPNTAVPPVQAPPSSLPAASCSRRRGYATACRTWCPLAAAAYWRTSGTTATPTCSSETSPATSWSSARTSTAAGTQMVSVFGFLWGNMSLRNDFPLCFWYES